MKELKTVYKKYAIILMIIALAILGLIMWVANVYKPAIQLDSIPPQYMALHVVLIVISALAGIAILLLKKKILDEVKDPGFKGNILKTLFKKGLMLQAPSLISLTAGLTMIFVFGITFRVVMVYFYMFIVTYYIGFIRSTLWRDILETNDLRND